MPETVTQHPDRASAAMAACKWVEKGSTKVNRNTLRVYKSKLGPYSGQVVGVGRETSAGIIEDFVRIDLEPGPKAIHYNAKNLSDTKDKLAAVITPSVGMRQADREVLYQDYLKGIANLSAETIWDWWRTGTKPTRVDAAEASVDEMQDGPEVEAVEEEPGEVQ